MHITIHNAGSRGKNNFKSKYYLH